MASRDIRHGCESVQTINDLVSLSAKTTSVRKEIGREWFKQKLGKMSPAERTQVIEEAMEKASKEG